MEKYASIIKDDIKRFIKNYLIAGELVDVKGMADLEEYIPSKYPYLSILYLLKQNDLDDKYGTWFVESYKLQLSEETNELKKSLGHFLYDKKYVDELKQENMKLRRRVDELTPKKEELINQNVDQKNQNVEKSMKEGKLKMGKWSDIIQMVSGSVVDMGTSVLWCKLNLGAENEMDPGDLFAWGALEERTYFAYDQYHNVYNKDISGNDKYDAALKRLGAGYRIPTDIEWINLLEICEKTVITIQTNDYKYIELTSKKTHNKLILPFKYSYRAEYWSSSQKEDFTAKIIRFDRYANWSLESEPKWYGLPIRPVFSKIFPDKNDKNKKIYLPKEKINIGNVFLEIIEDCLPNNRISVFGYQDIDSLDLNINKLNEILRSEYKVGPITEYNKMTVDELKRYIVSLLANKQ